MSKYFEVILNELKVQINARKDALSVGRVQDFAEYNKVVGVITGLNAAYGYIESLSKQSEEE